MPATTASAPPAASASRGAALVVLCAGFLMVILDTTVVSVALPSIQTDLGFGADGLAWVVNAYLVAFGGLLLLAGRIGDLIGRRPMFVAGLAVFVLASLLCALAATPGQLVAARFGQGVGGAMSSSVILGMLAALFPEPPEQARAFGVYAFVGATGASLGLLLGGLLTAALDWRWIFLVNLPIGMGTIVLARRSLAREEGLGLRAGADLAGAVLLVAALMVALFGIVGIERHGLLASRTLGLLALAGLLAAGFVAREATAATPLVPLRFFRVRTLSAANAVQVLMIAGYFGQQFLVALYLARVLGFDPALVGLGMVPIALLIGATSLGLAARLIDRFGARTVLVAGMALAAASLLVLARAPAGGSYAVDVAPALCLLGIGGGLSMPALTTLAMAAAPPADAGLASGFFNTTQQIASALGFAALASVAAARTEAVAGRGETDVVALASGYGLGFLGAALAVAAAIVLALVWLPRPARAGG